MDTSNHFTTPSLSSCSVLDPNAVFLDALVAGKLDIAMEIFNSYELAPYTCDCAVGIVKATKNYPFILTMRSKCKGMTDQIRVGDAAVCGKYQEMHQIINDPQTRGRIDRVELAGYLISRDAIAEAKKVHPNLSAVIKKSFEDNSLGCIASTETYDLLEPREKLAQYRSQIARNAVKHNSLLLLMKNLPSESLGTRLGDSYLLGPLSQSIQRGNERIFNYLREKYSDPEQFVVDLRESIKAISMVLSYPTPRPRHCLVDTKANLAIGLVVRDALVAMGNDRHYLIAKMAILNRRPDIFEKLVGNKSHIDLALYETAVAIHGCTGMRCLQHLLSIYVPTPTEVESIRDSLRFTPDLDHSIFFAMMQSGG
jgi:hypothetical protein